MDTYPVRIPQQLPRLLQAFRKQAGLSQKELGKLLGVTQQRVSDLERSAHSMSVSTLWRILTILGVELVLRVRVLDTRQVGDIDPQTGRPIW
jgi:HTH-type transcriptional regulator / antitoxin HipB